MLLRNGRKGSSTKSYLGAQTEDGFSVRRVFAVYCVPLSHYISIWSFKMKRKRSDFSTILLYEYKPFHNAPSINIALINMPCPVSKNWKNVATKQLLALPIINYVPNKNKQTSCQLSPFPLVIHLLCIVILERQLVEVCLIFARTVM